DDPATTRGPRARRLFLAQQGVVRPLLEQDLAERVIHLEIALGHRRAVILHGDRDVTPRPAQRDGCGVGGEFERKGEVVVVHATSPSHIATRPPLAQPPRPLTPTLPSHAATAAAAWQGTVGVSDRGWERSALHDVDRESAAGGL